MHISSFGRSFLQCNSCDHASFRRVVRVFAAARRRWPDGHFALRWRHGLSLVWQVDGCGGILWTVWSNYERMPDGRWRRTWYPFGTR